MKDMHYLIVSKFNNEIFVQLNKHIKVLHIDDASDMHSCDEFFLLQIILCIKLDVLTPLNKMVLLSARI